MISELRRTNAHPLVVQRVRSLSTQDTYLSAITIGELVYGIARLPTGKKRLQLESWFRSLEQSYASRVLPIDFETSRIWGEITASAVADKRQTLPPQDGLIAATALRHGLHLMTRNVKDFENTGVLLLNPWLP